MLRTVAFRPPDEGERAPRRSSGGERRGARRSSTILLVPLRLREPLGVEVGSPPERTRTTTVRDQPLRCLAHRELLLGVPDKYRRGNGEQSATRSPAGPSCWFHDSSVLSPARRRASLLTHLNRTGGWVAARSLGRHSASRHPSRAEKCPSSDFRSSGSASRRHTPRTPARSRDRGRLRSRYGCATAKVRGPIAVAAGSDAIARIRSAIPEISARTPSGVLRDWLSGPQRPCRCQSARAPRPPPHRLHTRAVRAAGRVPSCRRGSGTCPGA